jgi:hypothetical protein
MPRTLTERAHRALDALPYPLSLQYHLWLHQRRMSSAARAAIAGDLSLWRKIGSPGRVQAGPFTGLTYPPLSHGSVLLPKILGTYERELHGPIEEICAAGADRIIDIGAAEGYYAVGFARRLGIPVVAFEMHPRGRCFTDHLARKNGVRPRIDLRGTCDVRGLADALHGAQRPVVLSDCEGAEMDLLDPAAVPGLGQAVMLVELHEAARPGVTAALHSRFSGSHTITRIEESAAVPPGDGPPLRGVSLSPEELARLADERRGAPNSWMYLIPHARRATA